MMVNLPHRVMYKHIYVDSQHKMWIPRWGWSKKMIDDSEKWATDIKEKLNW